MKPYREYKTTDIPWLRKIPKHWDIQNFRRLMRESNWKNDDGKNRSMLSLSAYRGIELKEWGHKEQARRHEDSLTYKIVARDELVINPMWCINGAIAVSSLNGIVSPAYRVYRLDKKLNPSYTDYLLRSHFYIKEYNLHTRGSTTYDRAVRKEAFNQLPIVLPPLTEQEVIVTFLRSKEQEVEKFIANKLRIIDLLKDEKASLINNAITRGLNPSAAFKRSGISWLSEIPKHWEMKKLKFLGSLRFSNVDKNTSEDEIPVQLCNYVNVYYNDVITKNLPFMEATATKDEVEKFSLQAGDVVVTKDSEMWNDIAVPAYVSDNLDGVICGYHLAQIRPDKRITSGKFLAYAFNAHSIKVQFHVAANGITRYGLSQLALGSALFPIPPRKEQDAIIDHIDKATARITSAIAAAEREITLMQEYRVALIDSAVTGKIDVRRESVAVVAAHAPNRHIARAVLSAEIVQQLHLEPTFGRIKYQKILHLCEYMAGIEEIQGEYHRDAAGPFDNRLVYSVEAELKKQKWFEPYEREKFGHGYRPLSKSGGHRKYFERWWTDKQPIIDKVIERMRTWKTLDCEIFSTAYAAWNDLIIWGKQVTDDAIVHEILERWHKSKKQVSEERWRKAIAWMQKDGFTPTGFGKATRVVK